MAVALSLHTARASSSSTMMLRPPGGFLGRQPHGQEMGAAVHEGTTSTQSRARQEARSPLRRSGGVYVPYRVGIGRGSVDTDASSTIWAVPQFIRQGGWAQENGREGGRGGRWGGAKTD